MGKYKRHRTLSNMKHAVIFSFVPMIAFAAIILSMANNSQGMSSFREKRDTQSNNMDVDDIKDTINQNLGVGEKCGVKVLVEVKRDKCNAITGCQCGDNPGDICKCALSWWFILIIVVVALAIIGAVVCCVMRALCCCGQLRLYDNSRKLKKTFILQTQ